MAQVTTRTAVDGLKVASAPRTVNGNMNDYDGIPLGDVGELEAKAALLLAWTSEHMGPVMEGLEALDTVLATPPTRDTNDRFKRSQLDRLLGGLRALRLELSTFAAEQGLGNTLSGQIEALRDLGSLLARRKDGGVLAVTRDDVAHAQQVVGELLGAFRGMLNSTAGLLLQASEAIELTDSDDRYDERKKKKEKGGGRRSRGSVVQFGVRGGGYWTRDLGEPAEEVEPHIANGSTATSGTNEGEQDEKGEGGEGSNVVQADSTVNGVVDGKVPLLTCGRETCTGCPLAGSCAHRQPETATGNDAD